MSLAPAPVRQTAASACMARCMAASPAMRMAPHGIAAVAATTHGTPRAAHNAASQCMQQQQLAKSSARGPLRLADLPVVVRRMACAPAPRRATAAAAAVVAASVSGASTAHAGGLLGHSEALSAALPALLPLKGAWGVFTALLVAAALGKWSEQTRIGKELSGCAHREGAEWVRASGRS
eukprot:5739-Chlamydomonas_euryale.AAC.4